MCSTSMRDVPRVNMSKLKLLHLPITRGRKFRIFKILEFLFPLSISTPPPRRLPEKGKKGAQFAPYMVVDMWT